MSPSVARYEIRPDKYTPQPPLRRKTNMPRPDDKTVVMRTQEPLATLPGWFAHYNMPMIKKGIDIMNRML